MCQASPLLLPWSKPHYLLLDHSNKFPTDAPASASAPLKSFTHTQARRILLNASIRLHHVPAQNLPKATSLDETQILREELTLNNFCNFIA